MIILKQQRGAKRNTIMNDSHIQMLFRINAARYEKVKNKKKLYKFFKQWGHLTFEKADLRNNTDWFCAARDRGFMDAMIFHREGCRGVFDFDNFDKWLESQDA